MTKTLILSFILGLCLGSFLNVIIYRLPRRLKLNWQQEAKAYLNLPQSELSNQKDTLFSLPGKRSYCPNCHYKIPFYYNIPLLSYILLRGKCHHCHQRISISYPIIELISAFACLLTVYYFGITIKGLLVLIFVLSLITLAMIDFKCHLLPDVITLPLLWLGLVINSFSYFTSLENALWGAVLGYGILWFVYWFYKIIRKIDGLGFGDFKLLSAIGAWLGVNFLLPTLLIASFSALIIMLMVKVKIFYQKKAQLTSDCAQQNNQLKAQLISEPFAFGPFIACAALIVLFWHNDLMLTSFYLNV